MSLEMDGKGVFLTRLQRFSYGNKVGYKVYTEYDGSESVTFDDFWELEDMLTTAGHAKPDRLHRAITELNHIKAILMVVNNSYRVASVYASDGTQVTREQVIQANADKRASRITTPVLLETWKADIEINDWLQSFKSLTPALLQPQYGYRKTGIALSKFKRPSDAMIYAVRNSMKPAGQRFVPVASKQAA